MDIQSVYKEICGRASITDRILLQEYIKVQNKLVDKLTKAKTYNPSLEDFQELRDTLEAIFDSGEERGIIKKSYQSILAFPEIAGIEMKQDYDRSSREGNISSIKLKLEEAITRKMERFKPLSISDSENSGFVTPYEKFPRVYDDMSIRISRA